VGESRKTFEARARVEVGQTSVTIMVMVDVSNVNPLESLRSTLKVHVPISVGSDIGDDLITPPVNVTKVGAPTSEEVTAAHSVV
jgi:hypothetical protein